MMTFKSDQFNLSSLVTEKEKLQNELEQALTQIDKLRSLLAENTLLSLYTIPDGENNNNKSYVFKNEIEGAGTVNDSVIDPKNSRSYTDFG